MGEMADYYIDKALFADLDEHLREAKLVDFVKCQAERGMWIPKDGKEIHVSKMSDGHIKNCIALIKRNNDWRMGFLPVLENELNRRQN